MEEHLEQEASGLVEVRELVVLELELELEQAMYLEVSGYICLHVFCYMTVIHVIT